MHKINSKFDQSPTKRKSQKFQITPLDTKRFHFKQKILSSINQEDRLRSLKQYTQSTQVCHNKSAGRKNNDNPKQCFFLCYLRLKEPHINHRTCFSRILQRDISYFVFYNKNKFLFTSNVSYTNEIKLYKVRHSLTGTRAHPIMRDKKIPPFTIKSHYNRYFFSHRKFMATDKDMERKKCV